jgi:protein O-mannosyl-transferase
MTPAVAKNKLRAAARLWGRQTWRENVLPSLVLLIVTLAAYYPVRYHPFFGLDDPIYLTQNPRVLGPLNWETVKWAFTHQYCLNYDPITFLAHSINVRLFHLDATRHHDVNVALHILNVVLLFWLLKRCTGYVGRSFMVAALFALHPINVENVAWIAELKTLLSTTFFFLALAAYWDYAVRPTRRGMVVVGFLYALGLLAKPQVITLPFVLLLWDYWPLRRMFASDPDASRGTIAREATAPRQLSALITEKIPLFIIAACDAVVTLLAEHKAAPKDWPYTFSIRVGNAILSYSRYLGKAFWPLHLSYLYPHPGFSLRWRLVWASLCLLFALSALAIRQRRRRYIAVGWFWFLGTMVPMIGLVQIDLPAFADRWAYTSFIGIYVIVCWSAAEWAEGHRLRQWPVRGAGVVALILLALLTRHQIGFWKDDLTVWSHSVEVNHRNWRAEAMVGNILESHGQQEAALRHLYRAAEDAPDDDVAINWGIARAEHQRGNLETAIHYYKKVLAASQDPEFKAQVWANMGHAYGDMHDLQHAAECYRTAMRVKTQPEPVSLPGPEIHWQGQWWRDVGPYVRDVWLSH